jgi:plastocyanin
MPGLLPLVLALAWPVGVGCSRHSAETNANATNPTTGKAAAPDTAKRETSSPQEPETSSAAKTPPQADTTKRAAAAPQANAGQPLRFDAATNTVTFELQAGPFNFNGYSNGKATLVVPPKSNVVIDFVNDDGTPHSAEIIEDKDPVPNMGVDPAIPRAYTDGLTAGLVQGARDTMRFTAPASGSYRIFCGVPGHGVGGMWIRFKVDPAAKTPSWLTS